MCLHAGRCHPPRVTSVRWQVDVKSRPLALMSLSSLLCLMVRAHLNTCQAQGQNAIFLLDVVFLRAPIEFR